ncbi:MAG: DegV family protein [Ruminococcaceae bacterium]|nr:DegV family protein [Oscillospiraceae bacterium]
MSKFVIVTDSCADLTAELVAQLDIKVIPLTYLIDEKEYCDDPMNPDMNAQEFYGLLRGGKTATTAAVNVGTYTEVLEPLLAEGNDVLVLAFSSGLSTTYNSGVIAAEELREKYPQRKLYVVDTLCASLGEGLLVAHAAHKRAEGMDIDAVRDWVEANKLNLCHQFTVNDLFFLKRGGRVSAATAMLGTMLAIKPVMHVDNEGHLIKVGTARGRAASIKALADRMAETAIDPADQIVYICHGDCIDDANKLAGMVRERFGVKDVMIGYTGPVIGAHSGPGTLALFWLGTQR